MVSLRYLLSTLSLGALAIASPTTSLSQRQASEIPPNSLYLIEYWPKGCGNGDGTPLTGGESTLAACVNVDSLFDDTPTDKSSVRFLFPDDGRTFQWKLFGTNDCSQQIAQGQGAGCETVPVNQKIGAVIVYT